MAEKPRAEEDEDKEGGEAAAPAGDGKIFGVPRLYVFAGAAALLLLLLIGGGAAYFLGVFGSAPPAQEGAAHEGEAPKGDAHGGGGEDSHGAAPGDGAFIAMPPMNVNLQTDRGPARFLRLAVVLELEDPGDKAAVEAALPRVVDTFQTYLRELRVEDLRGSAGRYRLEVELLWRVNQAAAPAKIQDVLFQEILVN